MFGYVISKIGKIIAFGFKYGKSFRKLAAYIGL